MYKEFLSSLCKEVSDFINKFVMNTYGFFKDNPWVMYGILSRQPKQSSWEVQSVVLSIHDLPLASVDTESVWNHHNNSKGNR